MKFLNFFLVVFFFFLGCGEQKKSNSSSIEKKSSISPQKIEADSLKLNSDTKPFSPFYIYSDKGARENHYIPSGFMPNGKCIGFNDAYQDDCYQGQSCIKIDYQIDCSRKDQQWAGIYWLNPANNWGMRKGGYNLIGAQKLTFWARGESGEEQIQEFTIGGIAGDYPDTDIIVIGPVILTKDWRQYTIDLRGKDLSYISGGFAWSTNTEVNQNSCIFYLDEIRFE